jgi:Uma2 family endonuclease
MQPAGNGSPAFSIWYTAVMSAITTPFLASELFRLSVEQYHELIECGALSSDEPVELIEGILFRKMSKNPPHSTCNGRVQRIVGAAIGPGWCFRLQEPVTLGDGEPEPDGSVARGTIDDYSAKHPGPADLALVIEVADSSLDRDRGIKLQSYARAGIVCYWIINLIDRQIEVHTQPDAEADAPTYRAREIFKPGDSVPLMICGTALRQIPVSEILPAV